MRMLCSLHCVRFLQCQHGIFWRRKQRYEGCYHRADNERLESRMNIFGFILSAVDLWLLAIAGTAATLFVPHLLSISRENRARLRVASDSLCATFNPALAFLEKCRLHGSDHDRPDASAFLKEAYTSHDAAIRQFRPFVGRLRMRAYDKAWRHYCELNPSHEVGAVFMVSDQPDPWRCIQERIHAILTFAKT